MIHRSFQIGDHFVARNTDGAVIRGAEPSAGRIALLSSEFKVKSGINGSPKDYPHLFRLDLELGCVQRQAGSIFCVRSLNARDCDVRA